MNAAPNPSENSAGLMTAILSSLLCEKDLLLFIISTIIVSGAEYGAKQSASERGALAGSWADRAQSSFF